FAMHGWIAFLDAAVMAATQQLAVVAVQRGTDRDAAFGDALAGFGHGRGEQGAVIRGVDHAGSWQGRAIMPHSSIHAPPLRASPICSLPSRFRRRSVDGNAIIPA